MKGKDEGDIYILNGHEIYINHYNVEVLFIYLLNALLKNYNVLIDCNF